MEGQDLVMCFVCVRGGGGGGGRQILSTKKGNDATVPQEHPRKTTFGIEQGQNRHVADKLAIEKESQQVEQRSFH